MDNSVRSEPEPIIIILPPKIEEKNEMVATYKE